MLRISQLTVSLFVFHALLGFDAAARDSKSDLFFVRVLAKTAAERTRVADAGIAIDAVFSDSVTFVGTKRDLTALRKAGIAYDADPMPASRAGFPASDDAFHNHQEVIAALDGLAAKFPALASRFSIGKSLEGRELAGIRLSSREDEDSLPAAVLVGCHHAREHLSVEVPLLLAEYLATNYGRDSRITKLLDTREVWIVPMVNPDGAEFDISAKRYQYWRKNRRDNGDGTFGIDLNRNYDAGFGGPGASKDPKSDTYHGPHAFSEPETAAVRDFVRNRKSATVLLSFHTFSELVLWPYGHTKDEILSSKDREVFEKMGKKMASWNKYKPMKSSGLYLASGDTTDWAYDELKLFAFTFELSPSSMLWGGFYPGAKSIEPTFKANLEPALYLIDMADNPYRSVRAEADPLGVL
jgi:carboxypeptidase T